jgi:hypothetical protein
MASRQSKRQARRDFLKLSAAAGTGFWVSGVAADPLKSTWPSERIRVAGIGVGGKGSSDIDGAGTVMDVVAICDVDANTLDAKGKKFPKAKKYADFRKLLDEMKDQVDAVTVSGPDHMHAPALLQAIRMGKHCYGQKPLVRTVYEARLVRDEARKYKVCTQMGNQGTAENGLRTAVEMIQSGVIGQVKEIHVWTNRPVWPQAPGITARPSKVDEVPPHLSWDLWLGPAPERPFVGNRTYHDFNWRGWWDFGTGAMGDMACHTANMAFMGCKLTSPTRITSESGPINPETFPAWATIVYEYPARGDMGPCTLTWYEGKRDGKKVLPPRELLDKVLRKGEKLADSGSLIVGEKGILFSPNDYGAAYRLHPEADFKDYKAPSPTLPRNGRGDVGMKEEWARAIKENDPKIALSNFDYAAQFTESMLIGNVSLRMGSDSGEAGRWVGKELLFDAATLKVTNVPDADQWIKPTYRKGWTLDG